MPQKTIEDEELAEVKNLGIESFVKCTKNSYDVVSGLRSINLNFEIKIDGQLVGKGNNLNINNLTEADYTAILRTFGLDVLDDRTPFVSMLYTARDKEKVDEWLTARARQEKEIDDDQGDITEDPNKASKKQVKYVNDLAGKKLETDKVIQEHLDKLPGAESIEDMSRDEASALIDDLKLLEDAEKPVKKTKAAKPVKKPASKKK